MVRSMTVAQLEQGGFAVYVGSTMTVFGTSTPPIAAFGSIGEALGFIAEKMAPPEKASASPDQRPMVGPGRTAA